MVTLSDLEIGQEAEISKFQNTEIKCNSQRLGLFEGKKIKCLAKPGPIIIELNRQILAIGKNPAKQIFITAG